MTRKVRTRKDIRSLFGAPRGGADGALPPLRVALVGMMGSGKSTVGKALAERLGTDFVDLDAEIERALGKTVARIFAEDGEAHFRSVESIALSEIAYQRPRAVFALGGGAVLTEQVRSALRDGLMAPFDATVWLTAPTRTLARRLEREEETGTRPLLAGLDAKSREARLSALLEERRALYGVVADRTFDTEGTSAPAVARGIAAWLASRRMARVTLRDDVQADLPAQRRIDRSYDIVIEPGIVDRLGRALRRRGFRGGRVALATERNVAPLYLERARAGLAAEGIDPVVTTAAAGEAGKTLRSLEGVLEIWARERLDRGAWVVALGGGALTDAAGLAAALYLRGVSWVAVPTTLLGMVDAAIGGKTAVDLGRGKNLCGAFHQPRAVLCDPETLGTLPREELISGMGEVWKYALLEPSAGRVGRGFPPPGQEPASPAETPRAGASLLDLCVRRVAPLLGDRRSRGPVTLPPALASEIVARSAAMKARVVERDERETLGERKVLNLGHTIGHAIESACGWKLPHGACVAYGLFAMAWLSQEKKRISNAVFARIARLLEALPLPLIPRSVLDPDIVAAMEADKKFRDGRMLFVLLDAIGSPCIDVEVTLGEVHRAIGAMRADNPHRIPRAP